MTTALAALTAREHIAEFRRVAERRGVDPRGADPNRSREADPRTVALHLARPDEAGVVRELAALDDAPVPEGRVLLALIDGEAVAALSLNHGSVVANPFVRTREAVALLRLRAEHLSAATGRRPLRAVLSRGWVQQ